MREYELTVVIQPDIDEHARSEILEWLAQQLESAGATEETMTVDHWGSRSLAYPINDFNNGYYVFYELSLDPEKTAEFERNIKFRDELLRHLLIRKEE